MLFKPIQAYFKQRFKRWLKKRIPAGAKQSLSNKNIFILPTKFGFAYVFSVFILFLLGTNYQNNLIILMSYLFASLFFTTMIYGFLNMSGLQFVYNRQLTSFAKQTVMIPLTVISAKECYATRFAFENNTDTYNDAINVGESSTEIPFQTQTRGMNNPGRLKVSSEYPFGLFICWTHLDFDCEIITYPAKNTFNHLKQHTAQHHGNSTGKHIIEGGDDFGELREYKQGESNAQIAWKQLARGQGRLTKTTQQEVGDTLWLSLKQLPTASLETKLEILCYLVLDYHKHNVVFGLNLEAIKIQPSMGSKHRQQCLEALAFYAKPHTNVNEQTLQQPQQPPYANKTLHKGV